MDEMEHPTLVAVMADLGHDLAGVAFQLPHHIVHDVGDEDVFLPWVRGEIDRACRAAAQSLIGDEELLQVLALFGEDLDAISSAVADINQTVLGYTHAMHRRFEIL